MTERQPPLWIDGGCYTGEDLRTYFGAVGGCPGGGVLESDDLQPTAIGGMVIRVAPGSAWVAGTEQDGQGTYLVTNLTDTDVTIGPADITNPRIDLVVAHVIDPTYGGTGEPRWAVEVTAGVPAPIGSEQVPAPPPSSMVICQVHVKAATAVIQPADINDKRQMCSTAAGGDPVGAITPYAGTAAAPGFLLCDGTAYSRTLYATLFAVIGVSYGAGDGSTTFNVPNLRGRTIIGVDGSAEFNVVGRAGGSKTTTLTTAQMPYHAHGGATGGDDRAHAHYFGAWTGGENTDHAHGLDGANQFAIQAPLGGVAGIAWGNPDGWTRGTRAATAGRSVGHQHWVEGGSYGQNTNHLHGVAAEGGQQAFSLLDPYLTVSYLIKF